jgi:hypothetical protein
MDAPRTILAVVGEDDRYHVLIGKAIDRARADQATLIVYDLDAGRDPLESPLPTDWSADGTADAVPDRLDPEQLEAAGRHTVAEHVRVARNADVDAWGWLPEHADRATLVSYAAGHVAPLILIPDDEPDLTDAIDAEIEVVEVTPASAGSR